MEEKVNVLIALFEGRAFTAKALDEIAAALGAIYRGAAMTDTLLWFTRIDCVVFVAFFAVSYQREYVVHVALKIHASHEVLQVCRYVP